MSFSVANIGSTPANSVSVMIPEQNSWSLSGPNSVIIGNLNKGDYTVASFKLQSAISNITSQNRAGRNNSSNAQGRSFQRSMNSSPDTLLMQIAYTDTMGVRTVVEKQVNLGSQNSASAAGQTALLGRRGAAQSASVFPTYIWYILGIAVVFIGVVVQSKYKSKKLLDPDFKLKDLFKSQKK
jgi:hypothetical protein